MNNENINFPEDQLDEILESTIRIEPPSKIEENVMKKIRTASPEKSVNLVFIMIISLFGILLIGLIIFPMDLGVINLSGTGISLESINIFDAGKFSFLSEKPYLVMSLAVFAAALWMLVYFNLPKEKHSDYDRLFCI